MRIGKEKKSAKNKNFVNILNWWTPRPSIHSTRIIAWLTSKVMSTKLEGGFKANFSCYFRISIKTNAKIGQVLRYLRKTCLYKLFREILLTKFENFIKVELFRIIIFNSRKHKNEIFFQNFNITLDSNLTLFRLY